jgi:hypothetical protein
MTFEARESGFSFALLHAAEEGVEGLVHAAQHVLTARKICKRHIAGGANCLQLLGLVVVVQRNPLHPPGVTALLQGGVVQPTRLAKLSGQKLRLPPAWIQSVFEGLAHIRASLSRPALAVRLGGALASEFGDHPTRPRAPV